jgi:hypothetical protein
MEAHMLVVQERWTNTARRTSGELCGTTSCGALGPPRCLGDLQVLPPAERQQTGQEINQFFNRNAEVKSIKMNRSNTASQEIHQNCHIGSVQWNTTTWATAPTVLSAPPSPTITRARLPPSLRLRGFRRRPPWTDCLYSSAEPRAHFLPGLRRSTPSRCSL